MGQLVIACYAPKEGRAAELRALLEEHVPALRELGLVTGRTPILGRADDGTFVEVFEWASAEAVEAAHEHSDVQALWERFAEVCDYSSVGDLPGADQPFVHLQPVGDRPGS